ncbi:hypothetical protein GQ457_12G031790 [Hibiscus cannabinus]
MKSLSSGSFLVATIHVHLFSSATVIEAEFPRFYCVPKDGASNADLQKALDWACGHGGIDCSPIQTGGACAEPNTVRSRVAYAMNSYFMSERGVASACRFKGLATLAGRDPIIEQRSVIRIGKKRRSIRRCINTMGKKKLCVPKDGVGDAKLQQNLDWSCTQGVVGCGPIQPDVVCVEPATVRSRATFAMNSYYRRKGEIESACDFSSTAQTTTRDPSKIGKKNILV